MNKLYISGAITKPMERGEDWQKGFMDVHYKYMNTHIVYNPVHIGNELNCHYEIMEYDREPDWNDCMKACISKLLTFGSEDTIYMLPGWEQSKGACIELVIARELGCIVIEGV